MTVSRNRRPAFVLGALLLFLAAARLCHTGILWSDGDYHLAAAMQVHAGKALYRDLWYDKPPLTALFLDLVGRPEGVWLSMVEALVAWAACVFAFLTGDLLGGRRAGYYASGLLAFYLTFYIPTAVIPIAPDLLMIAPHLAAVYFVVAKKPWAAGVAAAVAFWINTKGIFVFIACLLIAPTMFVPLIAGFAIPSAVGCMLLVGTGTWNSYVDEVWRWSVLYARNSPVAQPWMNALVRTLNWAGFHAALVIGLVAYIRNSKRRNWVRYALWLAISFVAVAQGARFLPRYYFQLLAPLAVLGAVGLASVSRRSAVTIAAVVLLGFPLVRFGPAYVRLAIDDVRGVPHRWADLALDQDDQQVAELLRSRMAPNSTLFVWGYRPGVFVYTHLDSPSVYWDSQPLTGVPADRHLNAATSIDPAGSAMRRAQFAGSRPTFIVDALSQFNPVLAMQKYAELRPMLEHYQVCAHTPLSTVYCVQ